MTEFEQWETGANNDAHLLLRETPAWKTRERWAEIKLVVHRMALERELAYAHITENFDHSLEPVPVVQKQLPWWDEAWDKIGVYACRFLHTAPDYRQGDHYSVCPTCQRRYALPSLTAKQMSQIESGIYTASKPFVAPAMKTFQVKCKNGWMGER